MQIYLFIFKLHNKAKYKQPCIYLQHFKVSTQLSARKETGSLLRLWLSQGAYFLIVSQSSWVCIASTSCGLGTVDSSIFPCVCVSARACGCQLKIVQSKCVHPEGKRAFFIHSLPPPPISDILWPCMADQHQMLLLRRRITTAGKRSSSTYSTTVAKYPASTAGKACRHLHWGLW